MQQQQAINICWPPPHWLTAIVFLTLQQRSFEKSRPPPRLIQYDICMHVV